MTYNFDKLRKDLQDECYLAMHSGFPTTVMDLKEIDSATNEELLKIAEEFGYILDRYICE